MRDFEIFLSVKQGLEHSTTVGYVSRLRVLQRWLRKNNLPLSKPSIEQFLYESAKGDGTINSYIYFLRQLENYLKDKGKPQDLISGFKTRKIERAPIQILSVDQAKTLIETTIIYQKTANAPSEEMYRIFTKTLYLTCARLQELATLTVQYVDLGGGWITLTHTKGKKFRKVPIQEPLISDLRPYIKDKGLSALVFTNRMGNGIHSGDFWHNLQLRAKQAGIPFKIHPHTLRHSGASHLVLNGVPIELVSKILGHAELNTTMESYIHLKDEQLQSAMCRLPYYQQNTNPKETIRHILQALKSFKLEEDYRIDYKLEELSNGIRLEVFTI